MRVVAPADQELRDDLGVQGGAAGRDPAHRVEEVARRAATRSLSR